MVLTKEMSIYIVSASNPGREKEGSLVESLVKVP